MKTKEIPTMKTLITFSSRFRREQITNLRLFPSITGKRRISSRTGEKYTEFQFQHY